MKKSACSLNVSVMLSIVAFLATAVYAVPSFSDNATPLVTDRPDHTESTAIVGKGYVQFETGFVRAETGDSAVTVVPGTLFRIGLITNVLELRFGIDGWMIDHDGDTSGFGDSGIGAKILLAEESGKLPAIAVLTSVTVPTGKEGYTSERWDPELRFAFSHTINDKCSLGYNISASWESMSVGNGDITTLASLPWSVSLGRSLTDRLGLFVEGYGDIPINAFGGPANSVDFGLTWLAFDNIQFDAEGGFGLSEAADDWFAGAGLVWRYPR